MGQHRKTVWAERQPDIVGVENMITSYAKAGDRGNQTRPSIQGRTLTNKLALWLNLEHSDKILLSLCDFCCYVFPIFANSFLISDCFIAVELSADQHWLQKLHITVQRCPWHPDGWQWRVRNPALTHHLCTQLWPPHIIHIHKHRLMYATSLLVYKQMDEGPGFKKEA